MSPAILQILNLLRAIRDDARNSGTGRSGAHAFQTTYGLDPTSPNFLKALAAAQQSFISATILIEEDERVDGEGKAGIIQQIAQLQQMFSTNGINTNWASFIPNIDVAISQFSLISGFYSDVKDPYSRAGAGFDELVAEVDAIIGLASASEIDEASRRAIVENLNAFRHFVANIQVFGFDAAYSAYFDLLLNLRRQRTSPSKSENLATIWGEVERWAGRLAILEGMVTNSQELIATAESLVKLLPST